LVEVLKESRSKEPSRVAEQPSMVFSSSFLELLQTLQSLVDDFNLQMMMQHQPDNPPTLLIQKPTKLLFKGTEP
jgi:hypothetical protein